MSGYQPPVLLAASHQLGGFQCRSQAQTAWLVDMARQAHGTDTNRVFVVSLVDQPDVVAYYAWCMASVAIADLPERLRRGAGRYPQPVALLARLGVDQRHEGQGLGAALLVDVSHAWPASAMPLAVARCWCMPNQSKPGGSTSI
jgi:GNAT superfamily N-acetyltransferase